MSEPYGIDIDLKQQRSGETSQCSRATPFQVWDIQKERYMKKGIHSVHGEAKSSAPRDNDCGYVGMACEDAIASESEGEGNGSVSGCNANNGRASVRTANCNNHAGNGNNNYAGAFAVNTEKEKQALISRAASSNITDGHTATGGYGRCDYDSLPFMDDEDKAESNAKATDKETIFGELKTANSKRKLKNLKRFFINREIIEYAFDRTMKDTSTKPEIVDGFIAERKKICDRIERELTKMSYTPLPSRRQVIHKKGKGEKDRNADVFTLYDRIIQTLILVVIERKFRNMMIRNIYSGIKGRSLLSKDRRYCMINQIRHLVKTRQEEWVGLTDIRHFYENLRMKVVLGEMFAVIVCPYTRWLLTTAFSDTEYLPIGGCLSQIMAMFAVVSADRELLERYDVRLFCFGDNRLICGKKREVRQAMSFLMSYYEGRYGLSVKGDYQMRKVSDGFRFCKYDYKKSFVHIRAEIRRRSIRAKKKGQQHYAGYKGMLLKTDSARLRYLIENDLMELTNKHGMTVTTQRGDKVKLRDLPDGNSEIVPVEYLIEPSTVKKKDGKSGMMVRLTYIHVQKNGKRLCHTTEGSEEIVEFFKLVDNGKTDLHQRLHVKQDGQKVYFEEFHTTKQEACDLICDMLGI